MSFHYTLFIMKITKTIMPETTSSEIMISAVVPLNGKLWMVESKIDCFAYNTSWLL